MQNEDTMSALLSNIGHGFTVLLPAMGIANSVGAGIIGPRVVRCVP